MPDNTSEFFEDFKQVKKGQLFYQIVWWQEDYTFKIPVDSFTILIEENVKIYSKEE